VGKSSQGRAATKRVTAAKGEDAEALAAVLVSGGSAPPQAATQRAREEQLAATDALEAARSAVTRLERDLKDCEREVERADEAVRAAIAAMLQPTAQKMIDEAKHFRAEYLKRQHAIDAMAERLDGFKRLDFSVGDDEYRALCVSFRGPWTAAIERLTRDGDAPLPAIEED
jgi:DNA repair exonuclease SbcCD ATPase subunit